MAIMLRVLAIWALNLYSWKAGIFVEIAIVSEMARLVSGLGSMSSIAVSYGEKGSVFCGLRSDGSHLVACYGSDSAITFSAPPRVAFAGLSGGDGFVCGLVRETSQPYCWGSSGYIQMGVPQPMIAAAEYSEIAAGDYHLCALRKPLTGRRRNVSLVDCWGYNMTRSFVFDGPVQSLSAGSEFSCALFAQNRTAFCWGDETSSHVISLVPRRARFQKIAAGGYHVCGILEGVAARVVCWGRSLDYVEEELVSAISGRPANVDLAPPDPMLSVVGGKFHACAIRSYDRAVVCWGFVVKPSTAAPKGVKLYGIVAGNYFTCGILAAERSLAPLCWGSGYPNSLPLAVLPGLCAPGYYANASLACLPCSPACPPDTYQAAQCSARSDRACAFNCSLCASTECLSNCSSAAAAASERFWSLQLPVMAAEVGFALFLVGVVGAAAVLYVRYKLRECSCAAAGPTPAPGGETTGSKDVKIRRAQMFGYEELARATGAFKEESLVGKGSFSYVFRGVLKDGTVVAVKRAVVSPNIQKSWKEFHTELDLLSRLNHAHLVNLLGYCSEGQERLLVYEYMAHGSLHQHLHGPKREQLDWVRRVTIAVQAARGIEYLHGYACPPVIHRDIKSSNILIDEEHNARVADFGLSLLGPADSCSPLAELPAGTLGYLDPEYYRLHYLTTKSDVYSFGVLLLEILSGRKAIQVQCEEGSAVNIVEWAVPLVKSGEVGALLEPALKAPADKDSEEALRRIANVACKCVRMRGKERPSMDKVTTSLERALALLMGSQPILPTEVVLGSSRLHNKPSQRAPSWITFPSVASSQRRKSSDDSDSVSVSDALPALDRQEICPASPQQNLFLHHNF